MTGGRQSIARLARLLLLQGGVVGLGFLFTIAATRLLGMQAYGQITYVIAIANVLAVVMRYGTDETLIVSMSRATSPRQEIAAATLLRLVFLGLNLCGAGLAVAVGWLRPGEALAVAAFLLIGLQVAVQYDFFAQQHRHTLTMILSKLVLLGVFGLLAVGQESGVEADPLVLFALASCTGNLVLLSLHYRYFTRRFAAEKDSCGGLAAATRAVQIFAANHMVMCASLLALGLYSVNQIYIKHALSFEDLAVFAVQWQVCNIFLIYMKQVNRIYKPVLVRLCTGERAGYRAAKWFFFAIVTVPSTCLSLAVWYYYDWIFPALFAEKMVGYQTMFLLLTLFVFLRGVQLTLTQLCFVEGRNNVSFFANAAGAAVFLCIVVALGGYARVEDAAISMNGAMITMILVTALITAGWPDSGALRDRNT